MFVFFAKIFLVCLLIHVVRVSLSLLLPLYLYPLVRFLFLQYVCVSVCELVDVYESVWVYERV